jgi:hypothetical protein
VRADPSAPSSLDTPWTTPQEVVDRYFRALAAGDFRAMRALLADAGFQYRSPLGHFDDADAFVQDISRVGQILEGLLRRRSFVAGDEVCSILDVRTRFDTLRITTVVQLARVVDRRIVQIESIFDASEYQDLFRVE